MRTPISVVVMTKNEETNLADCLAALTWGDEIVVVDSYSTDATPEIAKELATRFVQRPFRNYADQRNFAQQVASHDWVFFVDADERIPPELAQEIIALAESGELAQNNAYHIRRVHVNLGRWFGARNQPITEAEREGIRKGETPRLFDRRLATWSRPLHETVDVPEPHGVLAGWIYHYSATNLSSTYKSINDYMDMEAAHLYATNPRRVHPLEVLFRGLRAGMYVYFAWRWWRYGSAGLHMAINVGFTKYLNYAKADLARIAAEEGEITPFDRALLAGAREIVANSSPSVDRSAAVDEV